MERLLMSARDFIYELSTVVSSKTRWSSFRLYWRLRVVMYDGSIIIDTRSWADRWATASLWGDYS